MGCCMDLGELQKRLQGKRVYCRLTSGEWRRGKVRFVSNDGFVYVDIIQAGGKSDHCFGYPVDRLAQFIRLA